MTVTWRASADLIAHAINGRDPRTACGKPVTLERLAYPAQRRCIACEVRLGIEQKATA